MATKTISVDLEAYEQLVQARQKPNESFSCVIKRAKWKRDAKNGGALLAAIMSNTPLAKETLDRLERARKSDKPPKDRWK